jgi:hypothetical protein
MRIRLGEFRTSWGEIWSGIFDVRSSYRSGFRKNLLRVDKALVHTIESNKLFVGSLFSDFTSGEDDDVICIPDCGKTVRDAYSCTRGGSDVKGILNDPFRLILAADGNIRLCRVHLSPRRVAEPSGLILLLERWRRVVSGHPREGLHVLPRQFHTHLGDPE